MQISARVENRVGSHNASVKTEGRAQPLAIAAKAQGAGSSVNGGELLFLALATCYCNDLYREAKKRGIELGSVEVEVSGEFGAEGEGAKNIHYRARIASSSSREEVLALMRHTDTVAEIQNTLRAATSVTLTECEVVGSGELSI